VTDQKCALKSLNVAHRIRWDAVDRAGRPSAPGVYMVRAKAGAHVTLTRVVLVH
jgi:hypothetical protein